jgi:hypothetical protein
MPERQIAGACDTLSHTNANTRLKIHKQTVDECFDGGGSRQSAGDGYLVAHISRMSDWAQDYESAYQPNLPGSGLRFVYSEFDLTVISSTSRFWMGGDNPLCKGIFYFPEGKDKDNNLRILVMAPGERFVSLSTYPAPYVFLPSYKPGECKLWDLSRVVSKGDGHLPPGFSREDGKDPAALSFVPDEDTGWITESQILQVCATALNSVRTLSTTEDTTCAGLIDLFLPTSLTGARCSSTLILGAAFLLFAPACCVFLE